MTLSIGNSENKQRHTEMKQCQMRQSDWLRAAQLFQVVARFRDGPFDIQGGLGFPHDKLFFSLILHNKLFFFKSKLQQVFYFK